MASPAGSPESNPDDARRPGPHGSDAGSPLSGESGPDSGREAKEDEPTGITDDDAEGGAEDRADPPPFATGVRTVTQVAWSESADSDAIPDEPIVQLGQYEQRYHIGEFVGEGAMGEVFRARDRLLKREVAIKYLKPEAADRATAQIQFWREAQNSGLLDHPCIPPVHDVGVDHKGRPFYVMRFIRGTSLRKLLSDVEDVSSSDRSESAYAGPRYLQVFSQVCSAVQFAHDAGFLHLDIKPDNIMVGDYGDVYLLDWGLSENQAEGPTRAGVRGTPSYMSPEQAAGGADLTAAADVFALGVVLFELVFGERPFPDSTSTKAIAERKSRRFEGHPHWGHAPQDLTELIGSALQREFGERVITAGALAEGIGEYLDGRQDELRRRARARRALEAARRSREEQDKHLEEALSLERQLESTHVDTWASVDEKLPLWTLQDALDRERHEAELSIDRALRALLEAQKDAPHDLEVRRQLSQIYWDRFERAERSGDTFQSRFLSNQLRQLELPEIDAALAGDGRLTILCHPKPTRIRLYRLVEDRRILRPIDETELAEPEWNEFLLPMGRYQLVIDHPDYRSLTAPVWIGRRESVTVDWSLRREIEIGSDFVHVPRGEFTMGGDDQTFKSVPRQVVFVDDFAIARYPVTWSQYREFLQSVADESVEEARRRLPDIPPQGPSVWRVDGAGIVHYSEDVHPSEPKWPIFKVAYQDALDYCAWRSRIDGRTYRLPTDEEWEKAARGVDGRTFPWGDRFDPAFCKIVASTPGRAQPDDVGRFETDSSPYGVRDLAGGVREWCGSWFNEKDFQRLVRGGSWNFDSIGSHCAYRLGCSPTLTYAFLGFRLAHSFD